MTNPKLPWFWRTVQWLEESSPTIGANLKKIFIQYGVPFNRAIGVRVVAVTADGQSFKLRLPYRRRNTNVEGTVHGAVITAFAETVVGVAVYCWCRRSSSRTWPRGTLTTRSRVGRRNLSAPSDSRCKHSAS